MGGLACGWLEFSGLFSLPAQFPTITTTILRGWRRVCRLGYYAGGTAGCGYGWVCIQELVGGLVAYRF